MAEKQGVLGRLVGIFGRKKLDPKEVAKQLRKEIESVDDGLRDRDYELRRLRKEQDLAIQKGVRAARSGDSTLAQDAAMDLRSVKVEIAEVQKGRSMLMKARLFCKLTLRRIETSVPGSAVEVIKRLGPVLEDEQLKELISDANVREDMFIEKLDKTLDKALVGLESRAQMDEDVVKPELDLFTSLAKAMEKGDEKKVAELKSQLTGEKGVETEAGGLDDI